MQKRRVLLIGFALLAVVGVAASAYFYLGRGLEVEERQSNAEAAVGSEAARFYASAVRDRDVYAVVERYLALQLADDRDGLAQLLSPQHSEVWNDDSYLLTDHVRELFDEVRLENLRLGVVRFTEIEAASQLASVSFEYQLDFLRDGQIAASVEMVEALALAAHGGQWLIERNERAVLGGEQSD